MMLAATDARLLRTALGASGVVFWAACGCVHVDQTLALERDGSGRIDVTYAQPDTCPAPVQMLARRILEQAGNGESGTTLPLDVSDDEIRRNFAELAPHGITLLHLKTVSREGWTTRSMRIGFRDLRGLAEAGLLGDRVVTLTRNGKGNYVLTQEAGPRSATGEMLSLLEDMQGTPLLASLMRGFRARLRVVAPTRIVETNAPEHDGRVATWTFDFDADPDMIGKARRGSMRLAFEGRGLRIPEWRGLSR